MTSMVQTDLGPSAVAKYKDEPIDSPVSDLDYLFIYSSLFCFVLGAGIFFPSSCDRMETGSRLTLYPNIHTHTFQTERKTSAWDQIILHLLLGGRSIANSLPASSFVWASVAIQECKPLSPPEASFGIASSAANHAAFRTVRVSLAVQQSLAFHLRSAPARALLRFTPGILDC